jgi:UDP:flavonoid glycosyltransferase YjiC (YdhE family)
MGRIVFAWEFGGGMGHIQRLLPLAKILQDRGHDVMCLMQHVIDAGRRLGPHHIKVLQAPVWQVKVKKLKNTFNYAEALFNQGYLVRDGLPSMTRAWVNLLDCIKPDVLVADHAPTALLAARGSGLRTVLLGTGFLVPPMQDPMPSIIPWGTPPDGLLEHSEKEAVRTMNAALASLKKPGLKYLAELFDVDLTILATFRELDHYQGRDEAKYWGPILNLPEGLRPEWPAAERTNRIFCYLKPTYPHLEEVLADLQRTGAATIIYLPNAPKEIKEKYQGTALNFTDKPVHMKQICQQCDMVICHAGHGTVAVSLLHGKPLLLLPEHNQLEQVLMAWNIQLRKLGLMIHTGQEGRNFRDGIDRILTELDFAANARKFADNHRGFDSDRQVSVMADRFEQLMTGVD